MSIQAYSSLAGGRFTGNLALSSKEDKKTIELLQVLAEKHQTNPTAIMLAWLFKIPANIQPIIGSTKPERILACKDAVNIELSRSDWYNLWITARGQKVP